MDESDITDVFPECRATREAGGEAGLEMHPLMDQISQCDYQTLPKYAGVRLKARNPQELEKWIRDQEDETS